MRIGCGRLVAVLWTLLMKDTSRPGKHHEGRLFSATNLLSPSAEAIRQRAAQRGVRSGREEAMAGGRIPCAGKTYTFCSRYVYVLMRRGIRSARATDEARTLSEGESRVKAQALGEGSSGQLARREYSKPPAGATRTAAGGFALAGVIQERERQGATYASEDPLHSGAHPYPRWRHRRSRSSSASRGYSTRS